MGGCATSTSPIRLACPPIRARPRDLVGRERESRENTDPGEGVCPVDLGSWIVDENAVRVVHLNPKLNSNLSEPDYGLQNDLNIDYFRQLAPGSVSFILQ